MKKLICILLSLSPVVLLSQTWIQKTNLPAPGRMCGICFTVDNKAYIGLGRYPDGSYVNDLWEYDPFLDHWTQKSGYPGVGLYASTAFSINGKGYICLGGDSYGAGQSDLWEYNPVSDTWSPKSDFPGMERYGACCFVIGDTAYIGTGSYGNSGDYLYDFWMYIPATDIWKQLQDFQGGPRCHASAFSIGNFGYLGTGMASSTTVTSDIWRYDKQTNWWTEVQNFPDKRMRCVSFVLNKNGYIGTGYNLFNKLNDFYKYDPESNWWSYISLGGNLPARHAAIAFTLANYSYVGTGESEQYSNLNDLWELNYIIGLNKQNDDQEIKIFPNPATDKITLEVTGEIGERNLVIVNLEGQQLLTRQITEPKTIIDISSLPSGIYFMRETNDKTVELEKILKE